MTFASASADVIALNEQATTNDWIFPLGTNLLDGATATPGTASTHEGSSGAWSTLTDGLLGLPGENASSVTPNNGESVIFPLDTAAQPAGYDITSFDSYCAWGDSGRDNQDYTLEYSTVADPLTFIPIATVANHTGNPNNCTHTRLTDTSGYLATAVHSIRINFAGQENGYTGFREFILLADPAVVTTVNESNSTGTWTLPSGTNLLDGATANTPSVPAGANHGNGDITSSSWTTLTDGTVGTPAVQTQAVAPLNGTSVIFPLDTSVNFNGYNISSFDSYAAWGDSGRDNQDFAIRYSTVDDPTTFIPLAAVSNHTGNPLNATHTRIAPTSGFMATGVAAVQFLFNNQENGYVGYREFIMLGSAAPLADPLTWTGGSGSAGTADWVTTPDSNWAETDGGAPADYDSLAPLTFDSTGSNTDINIPAALTASSMGFANGDTVPYNFGGEAITVSNGLTVSGSGDVSFGGSLSVATGTVHAGSGSVAFNGPLQSNGLTVSGTGEVTLGVANPLSGTTSVGNGVLNAMDDGSLGTSALIVTGGSVNLSSAAPVVGSLAGTGGDIVLGNPLSPASTTLLVGDGNITTFAGDISEAAGDSGSLTKTGSGSLTLAGTNSYTGPTTVTTGGQLEISQPSALYNANTAAWTAANLIVQPDAVLAFNVGGAGEFTDSDIAALDTGGFAAGAIIGFNTGNGDFALDHALGGDISLVKNGVNTLTLTGGNTYSGSTRITRGVIEAANPAGASIPGDMVVGNASFDVFLNMAADHQFGAGSILSFNTGPGAPNGKVNLRGTAQTIAGLDSAPTNKVALIQNDEIGQPGYTTNPGPASLTIDAAGDHSFYGIIRNQDGDPLSLVKNGPGTQELLNSAAQGYGYSGPTTINDGTLRLNFNGGNSGFASDITVNSPATFEIDGTFSFNRVISGDGTVVKTGSGAVVLNNGSNSYAGGTVVNDGILGLHATQGTLGEGTGPGQTCVAGEMIPSNVITVNAPGVLSLDFIAPLGNSGMLPQFAPSVVINDAATLSGGTNTVAFVPNLTLDGGIVQIADGATHGGFNTNLAFVGTVAVGGVSEFPSFIFTTGVGTNANASLGSVGLPGTVFDVADVTGDSGVDLDVSAVLRDVLGFASPLTKTGPGTMWLELGNSYTGTTTVEEGELRLEVASLADGANVVIAAAGTLDLAHGEEDTIRGLILDGVQVAAGTYGSTTNATPGIIQTPRITGDGLLVVTVDPPVDFETWALVIPDAGARDREDDADGDGFTNLEEFIFGTSAVDADGSLTSMEASGGDLIVRWNQRIDAGTYELQESNTMESWPVSLVVPVEDADQTGVPEGYVRMQATFTTGAGKDFIRIEGAEF
ncbi:beta strand repeat-containing protein [Luteolibacter marinus]|uniref:beta strand repeat-containing protein n=1 Tax=Luteolibacter marinus TaxID=2776705 RepID=UPI001868253A|nr:autotransporter-associated beta strand repeat-containing protein [Luteolibacter marinus]